MTHSGKIQWGWRIGTIVLIGGLLFTSVANAHDDKDDSKILNKLDRILNKLNKDTGQENTTLRWDQNLPSASRFTVLSAFYNQAVLDNNTGLVWEQSPSLTTANFQDSTYGCANKSIGGQKGWRLPAIPELATLVDPSVAAPGPTLPAAHPFTNIQSVFYWSATSHSVTPTTAWTLSFNTGDLGSNNKASGNHPGWCVRGPMNAETY
jgi:hypothetical protein